MGASGQDSETPSERRRRLENKAIDLLVAAQSGDASARSARQALDRWRRQSPEHARALQKAEAVWGTVGMGQTEPLATSAHRRPRYWSVASRAAALAAAALAVAVFADDARLLLADHRTQPGQRASIALPDGSRATLNTASAIDVAFGSAGRQVTLLAGEALFEVQSDPSRPFIVTTPQGTVRVTGTVFSVRSTAEATRVVVVEGSVTIAPDAAPEQPLAAEQGLSFTENRALEIAIDHTAALAWREGRVVFNGVPLDAVIAELDRYYPGVFVPVGSGFGERLVSAVFRSDEPLAALERVAERFGLTVVGLPGIKIITMR
ncbi:MAG: FecR domain-containing protein [Pseudomonadota bacterium]